jgi:hypothetical protein
MNVFNKLTPGGSLTQHVNALPSRYRFGHSLESTLKKPTVCTLLALLSAATAVSASDLSSLIDLPVAGTVLVPMSQYRDASSGAARSGSPVDIALGLVGAFEGARQLIVQTNEGTESPSASRVTVIRDGLLDDAVRSERWDAGILEIGKVTKAWRCWRGARAAGFAARPCP